jgi:hypothetical protein
MKNTILFAAATEPVNSAKRRRAKHFFFLAYVSAIAGFATAPIVSARNVYRIASASSIS